ncbi:MAG TPA: TonB-dependent receptor [Bryobacteraceae bacterium]|nr:TonB-dependent receptor [Bryobacteraceae bacterium]
MFSLSGKRYSFLLFSAAALVVWPAFGQTSKGTIAGTVTDPSGSAISGATVTAKDNLGAETRTVKTGSNGEYRVEAITPSNYTVTAGAPGFSQKEISNLSVEGSVVTSLNISLEVGAVSQTVSVEASGAQIQTDSGELSQTITTEEIAKLPVNSLNPIDLVLTQPGAVSVASRDNFTNGSGFSENGLRPRANNFLIDGFDNNDYGISGQALQTQNLEAVREVSVLRNSYAPEYGRGGASVTNVIYKNGTNEYHGSLWERYTGSGLDALTSEQKRSGITTVPRLVDNTFGFTAGGPVIRNKLFLFGSSQWHRIYGAESGNTLIIPTAQGVANLNAIAGADPNAAILVNSLGGLTAPTQTSTINVGNRPGCGSPCFIPVGQIIRTPTQAAPSYEYIIRGDYNASDNDRLSARYIGTQSSLTPDLFANPNALPTQDTQQGGPARNMGIYWTHVFSPTKLNEMRFTAQQINFTFGPLSSTTSNPLYQLPNLTIAGFSGPTFGGLDPTFPQGRGHDTFEYQDAFSWTAGNHSFKAGGDLIHLAINDAIPFNARGTIRFNNGGDCSAIGLTMCTGLANFLDNFTGPAGSAGKQFGNPYVSFPQTTQAYYFQDAWKVRPTLTLTYGVRWEYFGTPFNSLPYPGVRLTAALTDPLTTRVPEQADKNNWGPRVGLAWNPGSGKTVFRAGWGAFYDGFFTNIQDNVASSAPNTLGGTLTSPGTGRGTGGALGLVSSVTSSLNPRATVSVVDAHLQSPLTYQWNLNIERQLPWSMLATIAYVGTRGARLFLNQELNPGVNNTRLNAARGSIGARTNAGDSIYHGLQADLNRRFRNGFMIEVAYTYSKAIDDGSEVFVSSGGSSYPQDAFNIRGERGVSAFDRTHRGVVTWLYSLPYRGSNGGWHGAVNQIVRNWTISGSAQLQSGAPDTIYFGGLDENGDLRATNDRPDLGNPRAPINYTDACMTSSTCITGIGQLMPNGSLVDFNTRAPGTANQFRYIAVSGRPGNLGRNTFRNDWTQDWSLAVERIFPIPHLEGHQLEFRAEGINPFNHPNPGIVSPDLLDPAFMNRDLSFTGGRIVNLWVKYRF